MTPPAAKNPMNGWAKTIAGIAFTALLAAAGGLVAWGQTQEKVDNHSRQIEAQRKTNAKLLEILTDVRIMAATTQVAVQNLEKELRRANDRGTD